MQAAITANLTDLFRNEINIEDDISEEKYSGVISQTVDPDTGDGVASFTLSAPSGDLVTAAGELLTLGAVTYP
jgi:hypothetical protein